MWRGHSPASTWLRVGSPGEHPPQGQLVPSSIRATVSTLAPAALWAEAPWGQGTSCAPAEPRPLPSGQWRSPSPGKDSECPTLPSGPLGHNHKETETSRLPVSCENSPSSLANTSGSLSRLTAVVPIPSKDSKSVVLQLLSPHPRLQGLRRVWWAGVIHEQLFTAQRPHARLCPPAAAPTANGVQVNSRSPALTKAEGKVLAN